MFTFHHIPRKRLGVSYICVAIESYVSSWFLLHKALLPCGWGTALWWGSQIDGPLPYYRVVEWSEVKMQNHSYGVRLMRGSKGALLVSRNDVFKAGPVAVIVAMRMNCEHYKSVPVMGGCCVWQIQMIIGNTYFILDLDLIQKHIYICFVVY